MRFRNRTEAGQELARALDEYRDDDAVVYALPRGGVVLGAVVAQALHVPLDVVIARKIGHPTNPEYGICAISESGHLVCNEAERAAVDPQWFAQAIDRERQEAARRRERYLGGRPPMSVEGKVVIIVDDGIATGLTMFAAIEEVRGRHPRKIVVAIPIIPLDTFARLRQQVDQVVALEAPEFFLGAVGAYYDDFTQVSDDEVVRLLRQDPLMLFHLPLYRDLAVELQQLPDVLPGVFSFGRFPNDEMHLTLNTKVAQTCCVVLGADMPPDALLLETLLLCHTLKNEGAEKILAIFPYLAYMRQEKDEPGKSHTTAWIGSLLQASGIDEVLAVDVHSRLAMDRLAAPVVSLSPAPLFAQQILAHALTDATLVAPDEGGIPRCEAVRVAAGIATPIAHMQKQRTPSGVTASLQGEVGRRAVIIDDILDTGGTLLACCERLCSAGVEEIVVMVTHGLFTGTGWQRLWDMGVTRIYCTDTVPLPAQAGAYNIQVLSVLPLFTPILVEEASH